MSAKHGKQPRKQDEKWRLPLLAILLIGEIACLWITLTTSRLAGTPQWVISTAFLLAAVVIPSGIMHTLAGPEK